MHNSHMPHSKEGALALSLRTVEEQWQKKKRREQEPKQKLKQKKQRALKILNEYKYKNIKPGNGK
jgi:hypothetical protein